MTLTTRPGAVTGAAPVSLAVASTAGITLKTGITAESPGLLITSAAGPLKRPAFVRFPTSTPADEHTVLIAHNTRTGQSVILPHQRTDETGISALIPALDASIVPEPAAAPAPSLFRGLWAAASRAADDPLLILIARIIPESQNRDYDSNFKTKVNNWDFTNFAVAWLPFLSGADDGSPTSRVIDMGAGMVATSLWYFKNQRGGQPLYNRFRLQPDQPASNKAGIRWSALATRFIEPNSGVTIEDFEDLLEGESVAEQHWASLVILRQTFYLADDRPVPVLLYEVDDVRGLPDETEPPDAHIGIATRIIGDEIEIVVPENSDAPYRLKLTRENGLTPVRILTLQGGEYTVRSFFPALERPLLDAPGVASNWPKVLAETVGDAEGWPAPELHWKEGELDQEKVFVADKLTHWWECPACPDHGVTVPGVPAEAENPQFFQMGRIKGGTMAALPERVAITSTTWDADSVDSDVEPTKTGHLVQLAQDQVGQQFVIGWLDWQTVEYRKVSLHPDPAPVELTGDSTVTFTLAPSQALPAGTTFSWVLRTDDGRDSVATTVPTHTRELEAGTKGKLLIMAHEAGTKRVIARDSVPIAPPKAEPFWRIDTIQDQDNLLESAVDASLAPILFNRILAAPRSGLVAIDDEGGGRTVLRLRVLQSALWDATRCCPPAADLPGELRQSLGIMPEEDQGVGPFFAAWGTNRWSQSTEDLAAGTMTSQYVDGLITYNVENAGHQTGPRAVLRLTATRNGASLTGTITITGWVGDRHPDDVDGWVDPDPRIYRFPFTATRMDGIPETAVKAAAARRR